MEENLQEYIASVAENNVEVLVQPLGRQGIQYGAAGIRATQAMTEAPYPYPPVSTAMVPPHKIDMSAEGELFDKNLKLQEGAASLMYGTAHGVGPITRPPPQVMTALGPVPLPPEIRNRIPEKFVAKPIIEEREIYIAKKEVQERTIEVPHVHYEHKFAEIAKNLYIKKLVPSIKEVIKEVPKEIYKPVIEEKVIEVPQGVKYVEVPVEVPCLYPPKIVPKPTIQIIERVVETIKPIVKERIIEVPQTVVKQIPKIKTVEVPYYVPRYVEKVIEIPYQPPDATTLPPILRGALPQSIAAQMPTPFHMGPMPSSALNHLNIPYEAQINVRISHDLPKAQSFGNQGLENFMSLPNGNQNYPAIELPEGFQWGKPNNAPSPPVGRQACLEMMGCAATRNQPSAGRNVNMPPMMVTCPPEVGNVNFAGFLSEPDILTRQGVMAYEGFKSQGNFRMLFPPLASVPNVPMDPAGTPDVRTIEQMANYGADSVFKDTLDKMEEESALTCGGVCGPYTTTGPGIVYES